MRDERASQVIVERVRLNASACHLGDYRIEEAHL